MMKHWLKSVTKVSLLTTLLVSLVFCIGHKHALAQQSLRIAAVVNDDIISIFDLKARLQLIVTFAKLPKTPETFQKLAPETLQNLVDESLKQQEAKARGVDVGQEQINAALTNIEKKNGIKQGQLPLALDAQGVDIETLLTKIKTNIAWQQVVVQKYRNNIEISDEEVNGAVDEAEALRHLPQYQLSEILIPAAKNVSQEDLLNHIKRLSEQLNAGADFSAFARSFSKSASASAGGNIGWLRSDQLSPEIAPTVTIMQPGQHSMPIKVPSGYIFMKLNAYRADGTRMLDDQKLTLSQVHIPLPSDSTAETVSTQLATAREKTKDTTSCEAMVESGKSIGSSLTGELGQVLLSKLPTPLANTVKKLSPLSPSNPIRTSDSILVLMVCDREIIPGKEIEIDRNVILNQLFSQRVSIYERQYLRDLRRAAYIELR